MKKFYHQRGEAEREAEWLAWNEIHRHEMELKKELPPPNRRPIWLNAMGADDYIHKRKIKEMHMTNEEREDMCRRCAKAIQE